MIKCTICGNEMELMESTHTEQEYVCMSEECECELYINHMNGEIEWRIEE